MQSPDRVGLVLALIWCLAFWTALAAMLVELT